MRGDSGVEALTCPVFDPELWQQGRAGWSLVYGEWEGGRGVGESCGHSRRGVCFSDSHALCSSVSDPCSVSDVPEVKNQQTIRQSLSKLLLGRNIFFFSVPIPSKAQQ